MTANTRAYRRRLENLQLRNLFPTALSGLNITVSTASPNSGLRMYPYMTHILAKAVIIMRKAMESHQ